jgi:DNA processing protein
LTVGTRRAKRGDRSLVNEAVRIGRIGLRGRGGPSRRRVSLVSTAPSGCEVRSSRTAEQREQCIRIEDAGYPAALRHIHDPPRVLWARGARTEFRDRGIAIAIVGARDASAAGISFAANLAGDLAERGIVVVSGLARGIDAAAHRGALDAGGDTVAVVGCGTDVVYPTRNRRLREEILARSCVVGELPSGVPPLPGNFPRRNRIISGLSLGVVVVEASERSGSLVTARHAAEQGREVFAVPGAPGSPRSRGPHLLLKGGARLVEGVKDVLEEFPDLAAALPSPQPARRSTLVEALLERADTVDGIALRLGRQVTEIWTELMDLELRGEVFRGPGGRFVVRPEPRPGGDPARGPRG